MSSLVFAGVSYANPMDNAHGTGNHQEQQISNQTGRHSGQDINQDRTDHTMPQNQGIHNGQDTHQGNDNHNIPKHKGEKSGKRHR